LMMVPSERYLVALIHANRTSEYAKVYIAHNKCIYILITMMIINLTDLLCY